jgi:hypothetical protein
MKVSSKCLITLIDYLWRGKRFEGLRVRHDREANFPFSIIFVLFDLKKKLATLGFELRASHLLGRNFTT